MDTLANFKTILFNSAKKYGFSEYEMYYADCTSSSIATVNDIEYRNFKTLGISFRGRIKGRIGYSYTEYIDNSVINFLIHSAAENAAIIENDDMEEMYPGEDSEFLIEDYTNYEIETVTENEKNKLIRLLEKTILNKDSRIKYVSNCVICDKIVKNYISNSLGLERINVRKQAYICAYPCIIDENRKIVDGETAYTESISNFSIEEFAKIVSAKVISRLNPIQIQSGLYPVMLSNSSFISLLSAFISNFYADRVQKGFSLLNGKMNEIIASTALTIFDEGMCEKNFNRIPFDSEGIFTKKTVIIENGVLKSYLHNLKTAKKEGICPTGNGFRRNFRSPVEICQSNFYIVPSNTTVDSMINQMNSGIVISSLNGLHAGTNAVTGEFSLSVSGNIVKNGTIDRAVNMIMISGNFYQLLNDIVIIGNDLKFSYDYSMNGIGSPSVCVKGLNVSG